MTLTSPARLAIAILILALGFAAAFVVGRASAGGSADVAMPTHIAPPTTHVTVRAVTVPSTLPTLHEKPRQSTPAGTAPSSTQPAPAQPSTPSVAPRTAPPSGGGGGGGGKGGAGNVIVG